MFANIEWVSPVSLKDDRGDEISLRGYLPRTYYELDSATVLQLAEFICKKHPEVHAWSLQLSQEYYELQQNNCVPRRK